MLSAPVNAPPARRRPRTGYWIAAALLALAVLFGILAGLGFSGLSGQIDSLQRVPTPGQGTVTFSMPGNYLVFLEGPGFGSLQSTGEVQVSITNAATGQPVKLSQLNHESESYSFGGHSGQAGGSFSITAPGRYTVTTGTPQNRAMTDVALGPGIGRGLVLSIVWTILGALAFIAAIATWIITRLRSRARFRGMAPPMFGGPGGIFPFGQPQQWNAGCGAPPGYGAPPGPGMPPGYGGQPYGQDSGRPTHEPPPPPPG